MIDGSTTIISRTPLLRQSVGNVSMFISYEYCLYVCSHFSSGVYAGPVILVDQKRLLVHTGNVTQHRKPSNDYRYTTREGSTFPRSCRRFSKQCYQGSSPFLPRKPEERERGRVLFVTIGMNNHHNLLSEAERRKSNKRMATRTVRIGMCIILTILSAWEIVFEFDFEIKILDGIVQEVARNVAFEGKDTTSSMSAHIETLTHAHKITGKSTQEQSSSKGMALEFVHIPKTGGTSIEAAYIQANLTGVWGFCKFQNSEKSARNSRGAVTCRDGEPWPTQHLKDELQADNEYNRVVQSAVPWHIPAHRWEAASTTLDIYTPGVPKFCVVRHPYDRLVSEYYFVHLAYHDLKQRAVKISKTHLNLWAQRLLHERRVFTSIPGKDSWSYYPEKVYGAHMGHWIRQYDFVYDSTGRQRVEHILRFEDLSSEFDELINTYNLTSIRLPHVMTGDSAKSGTDLKKGKKTSKLTRNDLSERTKAMIHLVFDLDFDIFNYAKDNILQNYTDSQLWG